MNMLLLVNEICSECVCEFCKFHLEEEKFCKKNLKK